ncbi:MAG TPA: helix-turn-helix transcriptional regulator, partial [Lacipirellulaceae bacterium]|nr:helix-turn-helix transcriptional regulator [Lacipirellulaceae bacterium]
MASKTRAMTDSRVAATIARAKEHLDATGMTQAQLAERLGVDESGVSRLFSASGGSGALLRQLEEYLQDALGEDSPSARQVLDSDSAVDGLEIARRLIRTEDEIFATLCEAADGSHIFVLALNPPVELGDPDRILQIAQSLVRRPRVTWTYLTPKPDAVNPLQLPLLRPLTDGPDRVARAKDAFASTLSDASLKMEHTELAAALDRIESSPLSQTQYFHPFIRIYGLSMPSRNDAGTVSARRHAWLEIPFSHSNA